MKIDREISARIEILRFPLIIGVVLIHTYSQGTGSLFGEQQVVDSNGLIIWIQTLFSEVLGRTSVPLFFLISGVLLFRNFIPDFAWYRSKIQSRVHSILVPYIIWNLAVLVFRLIAESNPASAAFISERNEFVSDYDLYNYFEILWNPIAYQFWFVKDLFIVVLLSPIVHWVSRSLTYIPIILFFGLWLIDAPRFILFCCFGCLITIKKWRLDFFDKYSKKILISYLIFGVFNAVLITVGNIAFLDQFSKIIILLGTVAVWCLSKMLINTKLQKQLIKLAPFSFFVYAAHEPLITISKKISYAFFPPSNSLEIILYYFFLPAIVVITLIACALVLKEFTPQFYAVLTGGRRPSG
jgi:hypothetical protein